jgi:hypothetical protein
MIDRESLEGYPNSALKPGNRFRRCFALLSIPTLDADSLASSVGEAQARPSATGIWGMSVYQMESAQRQPQDASGDSQ